MSNPADSQAGPASAAPADWNSLARALRELHKVLMEHARRDYEAERFTLLSGTNLLRLLTIDPYFEWLRGLSELMVEIDILRDAGPQAAVESSAALRGAVEHFITAPREGEAAGVFAQRYWPYLQADPHVAMAHAAVKQALSAWPAAEKSDAASRLHARHVLAERAKHHSKKA